MIKGKGGAPEPHRHPAYSVVIALTTRIAEHRRRATQHAGKRCTSYKRRWQDTVCTDDPSLNRPSLRAEWFSCPRGYVLSTSGRGDSIADHSVCNLKQGSEQK